MKARKIYYYNYQFCCRCNAWRTRETIPGTYSDWFDGSRFSEEKDWFEDESYDFNLSLLINIDWWQPFQRTVHSMGGMYCSVLNLPRDIRQQLENIFTLGRSTLLLPLSYIPHNSIYQPCSEKLSKQIN